MTVTNWKRSTSNDPAMRSQAELWLATWGFPLTDLQKYEAHLTRGGEHLRAMHSTEPFYAKKAAASVARGEDPMAYWEDLFASQVNTLTPLGMPSTPRSETLPLLV